MKECPICGAATFDDALTCFGCLYRFGKDDGRPVASAARHARRVESSEDPTGPVFSFGVAVSPHVDASGKTDWRCTVRPE